MLSIEDYNSKEIDGKSILSNRFIMNDILKKISQRHKIDIDELKKYYDSFRTRNESPDDEFAAYIEPFHKLLVKELKK